MGIKLVWNRKRTASVVISKVKEFTITPNTYNLCYSVRGWFNRENSFLFGDDFKTLEEGQGFLNDTHKQM